MSSGDIKTLLPINGIVIRGKDTKRCKVTHCAKMCAVFCMDSHGVKSALDGWLPL